MVEVRRHGVVIDGFGVLGGGARFVANRYRCVPVAVCGERDGGADSAQGKSQRGNRVEGSFHAFPFLDRKANGPSEFLV